MLRNISLASVVKWMERFYICRNIRRELSDKINFKIDFGTTKKRKIYEKMLNKSVYALLIKSQVNFLQNIIYDIYLYCSRL